MIASPPRWYVLDGPASYHLVTAEWVPVAAGEGLLTTRVTRTAAGREDADLYHVREQTPDAGGRIFLLLNGTDEEQEQPYEVRIGRVEKCTCPAARAKKPACKHLLSILKLVSEGQL